MSSINQKLGLKPRTRPRQATHSTALVGNVVCPQCTSRHCLRTQSENGQRDASHWCGNCGHFFSPVLA